MVHEVSFPNLPSYAPHLSFKKMQSIWAWTQRELQLHPYIFTAYSFVNVGILIVFQVWVQEYIYTRLGGMQAYHNWRDYIHNYRPNYISLTFPRSLIRGIANGQTGPELLEQRGRKTLGEDVSVLWCRGNMKDPSMTECNFLSNKMEIDLYMFRSLMLHWIAGEIYCTDVITIDQSGSARRAVKLEQ